MYKIVSFRYEAAQKKFPPPNHKSVPTALPKANIVMYDHAMWDNVS